MTKHSNWLDLFKKIEFYNNDIKILRDLGHKVSLSGSFRKFNVNTDLFFCWWWGFSIFPLLFAKILNKKIIITGAFDYSSCRDEIPGFCYLDKPLWKRKIIEFCLKHADLNIFMSACEYKLVTENLHVNNPICIPLSVNTRFYNPSNKIKSNFFFSICWLETSNVIRKGLIESLEAFALLRPKEKNLKFKIAGKFGDFHNALLNKINDLGLNESVEILGIISDRQKLNLYRTCLAYVQPTLYEGFGLAIAEALSCGAQVITSLNGAVEEVSGGFAFYVNPKNPAEIKKALVKVLKGQFKHDGKESNLWINRNFSYEIRKKRIKIALDNLVNAS